VTSATPEPLIDLASDDFAALAAELRRTYRDPQHGVVVVSPRLIVRAAAALDAAARLRAATTGDTLSAASELLSTAHLLGMEAPAPVGSTVWTAEIWDSEDSRDDLGAFASEEAAWAAVRNEIVREWVRIGRGPWGKKDPADWLAARTDQEIVAAKKQAEHRWEAWVSKCTVDGVPARLSAARA
jgi:hypothetical protein